MKAKSCLALVLLLHFLAHPAVHAPVAVQLAGAVFTEPSEEDSPASARESLGTCLTCRTASASLAAPAPVLLPADDDSSEPVLFLPRLKDSTQYSSVLTARAPPLA